MCPRLGGDCGNHVLRLDCLIVVNQGEASAAICLHYFPGAPTSATAAQYDVLHVPGRSDGFHHGVGRRHSTFATRA